MTDVDPNGRRWLLRASCHENISLLLTRTHCYLSQTIKLRIQSSFHLLYASNLSTEDTLSRLGRRSHPGMHFASYWVLYQGRHTSPPSKGEDAMHDSFSPSSIMAVLASSSSSWSQQHSLTSLPNLNSTFVSYSHAPKYTYDSEPHGTSRCLDSYGTMRDSSRSFQLNEVNHLIA